MMWWWNNDGSGSGWPWILTIGLGILACVAMMAMMMRHGSSGDAQTRTDADDSPESVLARRLARGEIDVEEYERRRDALGRTGSSSAPTVDLRPGDSRGR